MAATPLVTLGGAVIGVCGILLGVIALRAQPERTWRRVAVAGIAIGMLALLAFAVVMVLFAFGV